VTPDVNTVHLKQGIVLHEGITGHPLNIFLAISLQHAKIMNKSKCWVCSQATIEGQITGTRIDIGKDGSDLG